MAGGVKYDPILGKVRQQDNTDVSNLLNRDGSNYMGSLSLVVPTITSELQIKKQDGTLVKTLNSNRLIIERGAIIDYSGTFQYAAPTSSQKPPTRCTGDFGTILPPPNTLSAPIEKNGIASDTTIACNLFADKSGLEVLGNKVVKVTGEDKTTATVTIEFRYLRLCGVSADEDVDITTLSGDFGNSRAKTIDFDCSGGKYFYYAYPKVLGEATWKVGGLAFSGYERTEKTITNYYGLSITYYVYRSSNIQTGSNINAVIS